MKANGFTSVAAGLLFAILWSSASAATKIGLASAQPFVIAVPRFFIAALVMLLIAHAILKKPVPSIAELRKLAVYGLLNVTIYLGLYVIAMQHVSAGLGSLFVGTNPVMISIITAVWLKQPVTFKTIGSLFLCSAGIVIAAYPLLQESYATPAGLLILLISMISYSAGALYFSRSTWNHLHILTINGWQTLLGGIFLLPFLFTSYDQSENVFDLRWLGSVLWLAVPVSIFAVQLWLYLLRANPVKASFWLFLCPISGFCIAAVLMGEPVTTYTIIGVVFVIAGLYMVQRQSKA
ncbi:DMT family transporter [Panacibacter sp. DH6]|uniref:DMT family transporter n=1 Tax=Panacibacter microcysteis TaxID=2793269 RepID=A0A931DXN8_9BACT|nr:DMT family transporter [Panacibacter microcysteis]MBG9374797.1 DMT family transporter [Panacibacter microcysteis]